MQDGTRRNTFRESTRTPLTTDVHLQFGETELMVGQTANISVGGMFVAARSPRPVGTLLRFEILIPSIEEPLRGLGEISWIRVRAEGVGCPPGMGIQFRHLDDDGQAQLEEHLQRAEEAPSLPPPVAAHNPPADADAATDPGAPASEPELSGLQPPRSSTPQVQAASAGTPRAVPPAVPPALPLASPSSEPQFQGGILVESSLPQSQFPSVLVSSAVPTASIQSLAGAPSHLAPRAAQEPSRDPTPAVPPTAATTGAPARGAKARANGSAASPRSRRLLFLLLGLLLIGAIAALLLTPLRQKIPFLADPSVEVPDTSLGPADEVPEEVPDTSPEAIVEVPVEVPGTSPDEVPDTSRGLESRTGAQPGAVAGGAAAARPITNRPLARGQTPLPATRLDDITWTSEPGKTVVTLRLDGALDEAAYSRVRLAAAPRELLRLNGIREPYKDLRVQVGTPQLIRIRSGYHPEKGRGQLHLVFDLPSPAIQVESAPPAGGNLTITLQGPDR